MTIPYTKCFTISIHIIHVRLYIEIVKQIMDCVPVFYSNSINKYFKDILWYFNANIFHDRSWLNHLLETGWWFERNEWNEIMFLKIIRCGSEAFRKLCIAGLCLQSLSDLKSKKYALQGLSFDCILPENYALQGLCLLVYKVYRI